MNKNKRVVVGLVSLAAMLAAGLSAVPASASQDGAPEFAIDVSSTVVSENVANEPLALLGAKARSAAGAGPVALLQAGSGAYAVASTTLISDGGAYELRAFWAAGDGFVDLSWADVGVDAPYLIYEDDELLETTNEPFRRLSAAPGAHRYTIKTSVPLPVAEWTDEDHQVEEETGESPRRGYLWSLNATVPEGGSLVSVQEAAAEIESSIQSVTYTALRYRVFIKEQWVDAPLGGCTYSWPNHKYAGDNRSYDPDAGTNRTLLEFRSTWGVPGVTQDKFSTTKSTGVTRVYDQAENLVATAQASDSGLWATPNAGAGGHSVAFDGGVQASDPFCFAGGIDSQFSAVITSDVQYSISGSHRDAPEHEIYVRTPNVTIAAHLSESAGLHCLVGAICPRVPIG